MPNPRATAILALCVACAAPAAAADTAHPGALVIDSTGAVVVASGVADGSVPTIARIGPDRRLRVIHRFAPDDTPGALARIGGRVVGIDGYPESRGRAFVVEGDRFRTVFTVPDDGYGTIAYSVAAPASIGYAFSMDGGRGSACLPVKSRAGCGAIEAIDRDGRARRIATFSRAASPFPLAGDGRSVWFEAYDPVRLLLLHDGVLTTIDTRGRAALDAAPFGGGALIALRRADGVSIASIDGVRIATPAVIRTGRPDADATLRARGAVAYAMIRVNGGSLNSESRLYLLAPTAAPRLIRSWTGEFVRLHFVDAKGSAVVSTEQRVVTGAVTTRGALFRIAPDGGMRRLPLGGLGDRAAVDDAVEGPDGAVWSLLTFYGAAPGVVRSERGSAATFPFAAGTSRRLRKN